MPREEVLVVRLEEAIKHLRLAVREAKALNFLSIGVRCDRMAATLEAMIPSLMDRTVLSCPNDPTNCTGCGDNSCFN